MSLPGPALVSPEPGEANGSAEFPEPRALPPGDSDGPLEAALGLRLPAAAIRGQDRPFEPVEFRLAPTAVRFPRQAQCFVEQPEAFLPVARAPVGLGQGRQ